MGTVVISIDAALGWRSIDCSAPAVERAAARSGWQTLLERLDDHELPATWSVVGHLLREDCDGVHEHHPLAPARFDREREAWADRTDLRFAPHLVAETLATPAGHELGFLPFSNVEFGHEGVSTDLARAECAGFFEALPDDAPSPRTAAFPATNVGHRDVLAEWGFECYRGRIPGRASRYSVARSARRLANATVSAPPVVRPSIDEYGLVELPTSLDLAGFGGVAGRLYSRTVADPAVATVRRGLDRVAATDDGVFHVRLRPVDVVTDRAERRVEEILDRIAGRRGDDVDVATVSAVADRARSDPSSTWSHPTTR